MTSGVAIEKLVSCPQCGFEEADHHAHADTSFETQCRRCGYSEEDRPDYHNGEVIGRTHRIRTGMGALCCYRVDTHLYTISFLNTAQEWRRVRKWLTEQFNLGGVDPTVTYLTRWNRETRRVHAVVGLFHKWPCRADQIDRNIPEWRRRQDDANDSE